MKSYRKNFIHQFLLLFSNCFKYRFSYAMGDNGAFNMTPTPYYMCHIQIFDRIDSFLQMFQISLTAKKVDYVLIWVILNRAPTNFHPLPPTPIHSHPLPPTPNHSRLCPLLSSLELCIILCIIMHNPPAIRF